MPQSSAPAGGERCGGASSIRLFPQVPWAVKFSATIMCIAITPFRRCSDWHAVERTASTLLH